MGETSNRVGLFDVFTYLNDDSSRKTGDVCHTYSLIMVCGCVVSNGALRTTSSANASNEYSAQHLREDFDTEPAMKLVFPALCKTGVFCTMVPDIRIVYRLNLMRRSSVNREWGRRVQKRRRDRWHKTCIRWRYAAYSWTAFRVAPPPAWGVHIVQSGTVLWL